MKISEILKLKPQSTSCIYSDFFEYSPLFNSLFIYDMSEFKDGFLDRIEIRNYSGGQCHNDGRSREVNIIFLDDKPVYFFQVVGKDYWHENVRLLDRNFITEVYANLVGNDKDNDEYDLDTEVELDGYGMEYEIRDDVLYWEYKR